VKSTFTQREHAADHSLVTRSRAPPQTPYTLTRRDPVPRSVRVGSLAALVRYFSADRMFRAFQTFKRFEPGLSPVEQPDRVLRAESKTRRFVPVHDAFRAAEDYAS